MIWIDAVSVAASATRSFSVSAAITNRTPQVDDQVTGNLSSTATRTRASSTFGWASSSSRSGTARTVPVPDGGLQTGSQRLTRRVDLIALARVELSQAGSVEGVSLLDHTADAGFEVEAPCLDACLARAGTHSQLSLHSAPHFSNCQSITRPNKLSHHE